MAAEEEEEDNFTTMPNYRWENQSTTDSAVQERLIGDNYEVYNYNNQTSGTQKFEKSRQLNSRDFYFESRFALDVGGNQTEYFRDTLGDAADFEEGDQEGVSALVDQSVSDGILIASFVGIVDDMVKTIPNDVSSDVYSTIKMRLKTTDSSITFQIMGTSRLGANLAFSGLISTSTEWTTYEIDVSLNNNWIGKITFLFVRFRKAVGFDASDRLNLDFIEIIGDLDYATHVEDEIEDTWDWEDSDEYWYDEESNVSDFNDGTTESWVPVGDVVISNDDGWLSIEDNSIAEILVSGLSIDSSIYTWITYEFWTNVTLDSVVIYDDDVNPLVQDGTNRDADTYYLLSYDLDLDADWAGTEAGLGFYFSSVGGVPLEVKLNMTYLYNIELGDLEGVSHVGADYSYVNPEGYLVAKAKSGQPYTTFYSPDNIDVPFNNFDYFNLRVRSFSEISIIRIYVQDPDGWEEVGSINPVRGVWNNWQVDFSGDSGLSEGFILQRFAFDWDDESGNMEGDEYLEVDYWLTLGHWSETDGFKFSLLNVDDEEGMSFQFTGNTDNSYDISIDMYDSVGIALGYSYSFNYSISTDGWLRIRVDWHLDKKNVKIILEYDNGTDIINIRRITDLYGYNLGFSRLLLLEDGFPSLCMNNSISGFASSYVIIDYVDADWNILEWREPAGVWEFTPTYGIDQDPDTDFTSVSPYGITSYKDSTDNKSKWYSLTADRFDGLTFDYEVQQENLDLYDDFKFNFAAYNVHKNGSLEHLFRFYLRIDPPTYIGYAIYKESVVLSSRFNLEVTECQGSISIYYDSSSKIIMQYKYSDINDDFQGTLTARPIGEELFTKEMVFILSYEVDTLPSGATDDILEFNIGGFELIRKDILGWIVGAILGPFFQFIMFLFSPFILIFQILTLAIVKAFKDLLAGMQPFFDMLGGIFATIIDGLEEAFGGIIITLGELLEGAINGLWGILFGLVEIFGQFLYDVIEWVLPILIGLAEIIITFLAAILDWFWVAFLAGTPLGFLIEIGVEWILAAPAIFMGIINLFLFWQFWILIGIWIIVLPMQASQCEGISDFIERVLGIFCIDVLPFDIAGFGLWFPLAVPLVFWTCSNIIVLV